MLLHTADLKTYLLAAGTFFHGDLLFAHPKSAQIQPGRLFRTPKTVSKTTLTLHPCFPTL
jgi:hypothetical protein